MIRPRFAAHQEAAGACDIGVVLGEVEHARDAVIEKMGEVRPVELVLDDDDRRVRRDRAVSFDGAGKDA